MLKRTAIALAALLIGTAPLRADEPPHPQPPRTHRTFTSSFETTKDFAGFYIVPEGYLKTSWHEKAADNVHSGHFAHKAWIRGANPPSTMFTNNNHRGYPTIQFQKTPGGVFHTPVDVVLWVWVDMKLQPRAGENEWFSFATFTNDRTDRWARTVLVNLSWDGFVHLMHVPRQGQQVRIFQTRQVKFPQRQWVKLRVHLDFGANGYAKVWQDGVLVSQARIDDMGGELAQAHFGLYAAPSVSSGTVYNDDLTIREVDGE
ncbi:MAG: hypothetical protein KGN34_07650 [Sphingomonadales bacterium]|nr:hypothetical protein [Sphingomonadales bacterium]